MHALAVRINGKVLKIDGYMLRRVWQALNCPFIHATFCVIATGASPGQTKMKAGYVKTTIFSLGLWSRDEHRKEVESINNRAFTRSARKSRAAEMNKSAITDHVAKENHVIDWSGAEILEREGHRKTRQVKESIWIRKEPKCMNRDGGAYSLPTAYDHLLVTCSTSRDHKPDEARRWRAKRAKRRN